MEGVGVIDGWIFSDFRYSCYGKCRTSDQASMAAGMLLCFAIHSQEILHYDYVSIPMKTWGAILFLSLGCSIFAYCTWYVVIEKVPVQYVALSLFLQPVIGSVLGFLVFGEVITFNTVLGGGIIVSALVWWQRMEKTTAARLDKKLQVESIR
jgi:drug/metabolite transporter (DMT)-like permease